MRRASPAWWGGVLAVLVLACNLSGAGAPDAPPPAATLSVPSPSPAGPELPAAAAPPVATAPPEAATEPAPAPTETLGPPAPLGPTTLGRVENFEQVGHNALNSRGWHAGLALNYPCAYLGNRNLSQIAVLDISDPAVPALVNELALPLGRTAIELRAVPDLGLLVALTFSADLSLLTFDVRDCRRPQPLASFALDASGHEFFLWRDPARPGRLLLYAAMWGGPFDLAVVDLSDPAAPSLLGTWRAADDGAPGILHSLSVSPDGRRAYLALWGGGFLVADSSDFASGAADPRLRLAQDDAGFAPLAGRNVHSAAPLADPRYVLLTQEVYTCPFAGLLVADVSNAARPALAGRFDLPENEAGCDDLPQADAVFTSHNPLVVGDLVFVTWYGGGLQALDLRDPARPRRVGLFVPEGAGAAVVSYVGTYPAQMWSYPILREGLLHVGDIQSGLYILRYNGPGSEALAGVPLAEGNVTILP